MRTIIAGGRDYTLTDDDMSFLASLPITEVVSGCAQGADQGGELFANKIGIKCTKFPAEWSRYGNAAGHIRNRQMADYVKLALGAVVLFPGGRGTDNMHKIAIKLGLKIYDRRNA